MLFTEELDDKKEFIEIRKEELRRLYQQIMDYEQLINALRNQNSIEN